MNKGVNEWKTHLILTAPGSQCRGEWLTFAELLVLAAWLPLTHPDFLEQRSTNVFREEPDGKCFELCRTVSVNS